MVVAYPADWPMRTPHLLPAVLALSIAAVALAFADRYACRIEEDAVHALAAKIFQQKNQGRALQAAAFRQADLLPLYGGSEVVTDDPYDANTLFQAYPEGFTVFPVGKAANDCLNILHKLAAVGDEIRGRTVVISIAPISFYNCEMTVPDNYAGNFSLLQASEMVFSRSLSLKLKRAAARRMLDYPATLQSEPLLSFAVQNLDAGSPLGNALYYLALPAGELQLAGLRLQDHAAAWLEVRNFEPLATPARKADRLDWTALEARSEKTARELAGNNPFGFGAYMWKDHQNQLMHRKIPHSEDDYLWMLDHTKEWTDLDLLLRLVNELGCRTLVISSPMMGKYLDYLGITAKDREVYYAKLAEAVHARGAELRAFQKYDEATDFLLDDWGHLNCKGWVLYDRELADFYHRSR
jgi:D-alanine transfer protein